MKRTGVKMFSAVTAGAILWTGLGVVQDNRAYAAVYTAVVNPSVQNQTWEGWGTSLAWWANRVGGDVYSRDEYADLLFSDEGLDLNIVRYNIGGGENPDPASIGLETPMDLRAQIPGYKASANAPYDWTQDANQRWVLDAAKSRIDQNEFIAEAFANSPPWWMTKSGSVTGNKNGTENLKEDMYDDFADYLTTVVKQFRDNWGTDFRTLSAFNEPSAGYWYFDNRQEGNRMLPPNQGIMIGELYNELAAKGLTTGISAPEETNIDVARDTINSYSQATKDKVVQFNTHSYEGSDRTGLNVAAGGKRIWNSEHGDGVWDGLTMSRNILKDIKEMKSSAWVNWQVVENTGNGWGAIGTQLNDPNANLGTYTINKKYYMLAQWSKFIRPGYRIIDIVDDNSVAAYDSENGELVIVTINSNDAANTITYDLSQFTNVSGSLNGYCTTTGGENLAAITGLNLSGKSFTSTVPAKAVSTFVVTGVTGIEASPVDPTPGLQTLMTDNFEDGDAQGWTAGSGSWSVVADGTNVYKQSANTANEAVTTRGDTAWTNYDILADVNLKSTSNTAATGILGRYKDNNNYYYLRLNSGESKLQLLKKVNGTFTLLANLPQTVSLNTTYKLRLSMNGSTIKGYLNGEEKISVTDTSLTAGKAGIRTYSQVATIDGVRVAGVPVVVVVDNGDPGFSTTGAWTASTYDQGYQGTNYLHDGAEAANADKWAVWTPNIAEAGTYKVYMKWTATSNRPTAAPLEIKYGGVLDSSKTVNQTVNGGQWVELGTYVLTASSTANSVKLLASAYGYTIADAVRFVKI
ncbi:O-Glycosyl hydrolase [Paenibacillaceae bacterium GAS479]|nr:O-Glycosyl hydrolase [Paenibacillaceae bacterium GAS479]